MAELSRDLDIPTKIIPLDLTGNFEDEYSALLEAEKPEVGLLINNAGCGYLSSFDISDTGDIRRMTELNITALSLVTRITLPFMPNSSRIINISSIASFAPNARMAVYSSTKAYVSSFSRALHEELRPRRISVTAVCPGPMATEFLTVGRINGNSRMFETLPPCDPAKTAAGALRASKAGRAFYTPRAFYKFYRGLAKVVPHAILVKIVKT